MTKNLPAKRSKQLDEQSESDVMGYALIKAIDCLCECSKTKAAMRAQISMERAKSDAIIERIREENRRSKTRVKIGELEIESDSIGGNTAALASVFTVAGVGAIAALSICGGRHEKS